MGLDLYLLPFDCDLPVLAFSHTVLDCCRRRDLFEALMKIEKEIGKPVPDGFQTHIGCESGYGTTINTPYGEPLHYATCADLRKVRSHEGVQDNTKNTAIWMYLLALDPDTKVALYWH